MGAAEDTEWRDVFHFPYGEEGGLVDFIPGGATAYLTSSLGRETTALLRVDLSTGETLETLYSNDICNVGGVTLDRDSKELRALTYNYARTVRERRDVIVRPPIFHGALCDCLSLALTKKQNLIGTFPSSPALS
jgi:hypothetical protein